jgi:hypothetical protein
MFRNAYPAMRITREGIFVDIQTYARESFWCVWGFGGHGNSVD